MWSRYASLISVFAGAAGPVPGDAAEHRARHQPGAARIIEIEKTAHEFAGRIEAADRIVVGAGNPGRPKGSRNRATTTAGLTFFGSGLLPRRRASSPPAQAGSGSV
jgi:hypothetical protein